LLFFYLSGSCHVRVKPPYGLLHQRARHRRRWFRRRRLDRGRHGGRWHRRGGSSGTSGPEATKGRRGRGGSHRHRCMWPLEAQGRLREGAALDHGPREDLDAEAFQPRRHDGPHQRLLHHALQLRHL